MVSALLLYGCTSASGEASQVQTGQNPKVPPAPPDASIGKGGVVAENKTGFEKTKQAIETAVADGTYSKEVQYAYHSGTETVGFSVGVKGDVVTDVSVTPSPNPHKVSARIIKDFSDALPDLVVGKKITEIKLPKNVAGSSLTTAAFQQYVDGIVQGQERASS